MLGVSYRMCTGNYHNDYIYTADHHDHICAVDYHYNSDGILPELR